MSQIEGQQVEEQQVEPILTDGGEGEYATEDERLFAEEFDRRAAMERGDEPEPISGEEVPDAGAPPADALPSEPPTPVASTEPPADGTAPPEPALAPAEDKPAWYNELTDEAKLAFDQKDESINQLQWQYTAVHGRLAPVQAQVERLQRQLSSGQPAAQPTPGGQPTPIAPTPTTDFESEEFLAFEKDYPDEAKAMKALFTNQQAHVQQLEQKIGTLSQGFEQVQATSNAQAQQNELNTLTERHPDWMQVRNSPQFDSWLKTQPVSVQPLVGSELAADCIFLMDRYKQDVYLYELSAGAGGETQPTDAQVTADKTRQHRQSLISTPTPNPQGGGVGVPGVTAAPQSNEEMWIEEVERRVRAQKNMR